MVTPVATVIQVWLQCLGKLTHALVPGKHVSELAIKKKIFVSLVNAQQIMCLSGEDINNEADLMIYSVDIHQPLSLAIPVIA